MKTLHCFLVGVCALFSLLIGAAAEQLTDNSLSALILEKDARFWKAYNSCDIEKCREFFTDDVEFYHDKGGVTLGIEALVETMKNNLCGSGKPRLRREAVTGTAAVFALRNGGEMYGAILSGEHVFYVTEDEKPEFLDGRANFTHLWLLKNGVWKMARVLSFNHHPAPYQNKLEEITLPRERLDRLAGIYSGPQSGKVTVLRDNDSLVLQTDKDRFVLYAESEDSFFAKERPLKFQFVTKGGAVSKLVVRENGSVAEELSR